MTRHQSNQRPFQAIKAFLILGILPASFLGMGCNKFDPTGKSYSLQVQKMTDAQKNEQLVELVETDYRSGEPKNKMGQILVPDDQKFGPVSIMIGSYDSVNHVLKDVKINGKDFSNISMVPGERTGTVLVQSDPVPIGDFPGCLLQLDQKAEFSFKDNENLKLTITSTFSFIPVDGSVLGTTCADLFQKVQLNLQNGGEVSEPFQAAKIAGTLDLSRIGALQNIQISFVFEGSAI